MVYSLMDKVKRFVCKTIGHKPFETWFFNGFAYHSCKRCKEVYHDISDAREKEQLKKARTE